MLPLYVKEAAFRSRAAPRALKYALSGRFFCDLFGDCFFLAWSMTLEFPQSHMPAFDSSATIKVVWLVEVG